MQASVWLHCSFVTLNSYIKSPQKFVLCYLSVACSQFLACFTVQFSRCRFSNLFQGQIEIFFSEYFNLNSKFKLVGPSGLEPPTSRLSVVRSSQLSYGPVVAADFVSLASTFRRNLARSVAAPLPRKPAHAGLCSD